jgi:eukaryotic-like serine/threonine-protein kinase
VWLYDLGRDVPSPVTSSRAAAPVWTPDGQRIAFAMYRNAGLNPSGAFSARAADPTNLAWQRADGSGDAERLTDSPQTQAPGSWHPNGRLLAFQEEASPNKFDLRLLPIEGSEASGWKSGTPRVFLSGLGSMTDPQFSPDGGWIAYVSTETGRPEVWVSPASGAGARRQISTAGGVSPAWSRRTKELFFTTESQEVMVATYSVAGGAFQPEKPRRWADVQIGAGLGSWPRRFDVQADGERIIAALGSAQQARLGGSKIVLVFNFFDELRRVAPIGK